MNFISILIFLICVIFIAFCLYYVIKNIKNQIQGKGCGKCSNCRSNCNQQNKITYKK